MDFFRLKNFDTAIIQIANDVEGHLIQMVDEAK